MKKQYNVPKAEMLEFNYAENVLASGSNDKPHLGCKPEPPKPHEDPKPKPNDKPHLGCKP